MYLQSPNTNELLNWQTNHNNLFDFFVRKGKIHSFTRASLSLKIRDLPTVYLFRNPHDGSGDLSLVSLRLNLIQGRFWENYLGVISHRRSLSPLEGQRPVL